MNFSNFLLPLSLVLSLLTPVLIRGGATWSIDERMRQLKVPGVSVAVIKDFKVEWAKGYGVRDAQTREPMTERTTTPSGC